MIWMWVGTYLYSWESRKVLGNNFRQGWVPDFVAGNQSKYWVLILGGGGTTLIFAKIGLVTYGAVFWAVDPPPPPPWEVSHNYGWQ